MERLLSSPAGVLPSSSPLRGRYGHLWTPFRRTRPSTATLTGWALAVAHCRLKTQPEAGKIGVLVSTGARYR